MHKVTDKTDYISLIRSIAGRRIGLNARISDPSYAIRHDVDKDLDHALEMARFESEIGIRSTYFLLHTASYFDYSELFLKKCLEFQDLGHEVGIHNNLVIEWLSLSDKKYRTLSTGLRAPIDFLRQGGIEIVGTSAHGSDKNQEQKIYNFQVWKEYDPKEILGLSGCPELKHSFSLAEFGLEYEAYFLPYTHYLSDSGGNWLGQKIDGCLKVFERDLLYLDDNIGLEVIEDFNKNGGFLQVLIHPCWWEGE